MISLNSPNYDLMDSPLCGMNITLDFPVFREKTAPEKDVRIASALYPLAPSLWWLAILHGIYGAAYDLIGVGPIIVFATRLARDHNLLRSMLSCLRLIFTIFMSAVITNMANWKDPAFSISKCTFFYGRFQ